MANGIFGGGNGTAMSPYIVEDWMDLREIRNKPVTSHFVQSNDIDMTNASSFTSLPYAVNYDGKRFKISNLKVPLFYSCSPACTLKDINLVNVDITQTNSPYTGALLCTYESASGLRVTIMGCSTSGIVRGKEQVGGLVGYVYNSTSGAYIRISNSYSTCTVSGTRYIGGFIGSLYGHQTDMEVKHCYSTGDVYGTEIVGGFAGGYNPPYSNSTGLVSLCKNVYRINASTNSDFGSFAGVAVTTPSGKVYGSFALDSCRLIDIARGL